mmetsp:Transcript_126699/g.370213  ORF Transcript_126699/g.370213 Transcript_126699/m.370213 type:complete len:256 (+) Transcript_126699:406-1173(+)
MRKPRGAEAFAHSSSMPSLFTIAQSMLPGDMMSEEPVSMAAWHPALPHSPAGFPPMVTSSTKTCQLPCDETGTHASSEAMRSGRYPPKRSSPPACDELAKYSAKTPLSTSLPPSRARGMLNSGESVLFRARPTTPSKSRCWKGSSDSSVRTTKSAVPQNWPSRSTQTLSRTNSPVTSEPRRDSVFVSRSSLVPMSVVGSSAQPICRAVEEFSGNKRRCFSQAASPHLELGRIISPEPVSKTTLNSCSGLPTYTMP